MLCHFDVTPRPAASWPKSAWGHRDEGPEVLNGERGVEPGVE